ncbi:MAG TPA: Na+/H+ antiporter NhaA [Alphaproteobacteria bacterium]|nr:Na+/H+ antiporter NhaA [Alphaproteobacteria bacterium]
MVVLKEFMQMEAAAGIILLICAIVALILANTPLEFWYNMFLYDTTAEIRVGNGPLHLEKPLILWINDGLMTIFFFLVGLELKREMMEGMLSKPSQVVLPIIAAIGGMAAPALIFYGFNVNNPDPSAIHGWAIPTATDIAFAIGIFSLVGKGLPSSLKVFLLALAIIDDLGAILIIGIFYSHGLSVMNLGLAAVFLAILILLNRMNSSKGSVYLLFGFALWFCVLKSGVHATISGVIIAFCIPLTTPGNRRSLLRQLEHDMHPMVAFYIMPLFAIANAGVSLAGSSWNLLIEPITLGVALGLFLGKQIGIVGAVFLAVKLKLAKLPKHCNWIHMFGVAILAGIGFTMSLFVSSLAFGGGHSGIGGFSSHLVEAKVGILMGSTVSAIVGLLILKYASKHFPVTSSEDEIVQEVTHQHDTPKDAVKA